MAQPKKIIILAGGDNPEREVSLRSGQAVTDALLDAGYEVKQLDPSQPPADYEAQLKDCDVVFPALHGKGYEDGTLQTHLESLGVRYVGSDPEASRISFDKRLAKERMVAAGLPVPNGQILSEADFWNSPLIEAPFVLKPYDGGSSIDTFIVRDVDTIDRAVLTDAFSRHSEMLLEELIEGQEITIAILCEEILPAIEIVPPTGGEFDYENKYNGQTQELCPPVSISHEDQVSAQQLAKRVDEIFNIRDMSRTDIIIGPGGKLVILETNTIPGLTDQSLLPKAAAAAGYSMFDVANQLVEAALKRG